MMKRFEWRKKVNYYLKNTYRKIFQKIDKLIYLKAPSFNHIFEWRLLQEQKLKLTSKNKEIMSKKEIRKFIMFYERITKQMMKDFPKISNLTIFLDSRHRSKKMKFLNEKLFIILVFFCSSVNVLAENHLKFFIEAALKITWN